MRRALKVHSKIDVKRGLLFFDPISVAHKSYLVKIALLLF